jgi:hypothetical protein
MGSVLYDFLNDSFLLDPMMVEDLYSSLPEIELRSELERYRNHCLAHWNDLLAEIGGAQPSLRLFAGASFRRLDALKQAAFYLDAVVLPDPLFPHTEEPSKFGRVMSQYLEMSRAEEVNRKELAEAAAFMNGSIRNSVFEAVCGSSPGGVADGR